MGIFREGGVTDGVRTRDNRNHNPALYQLSYGHRDRTLNLTAPIATCKENPCASADYRG